MLITGKARRGHWSSEQKLQIIGESFRPRETVSSVARPRRVALNLLYHRRRLWTGGGAAAVGSDEQLVAVWKCDLSKRARPRTAAQPEDDGSRDPQGGAGKVGVNKPRLRLLSQPRDGPDDGGCRDDRSGPLPSS